MELQRLVRDLRLGSEVAEQDDQLARYFVENAAYYDVVDDEVDLILGPKGSGKSAISRRLVDPQAYIPQLEDVDIVPAFNLQGSSLFRRLASEVKTVNEGTMRTAWTIYILGLIGNHLVDRYDNGYVRDIADKLDELGLRSDEGLPKSMWSSVISTIRNLRSSKVEASLTVTDTGMPIGTAAVTMDRSDAIRTEVVDWEALLQLEIEALDFLGRRCWVVFDRLDEAFPHDRELEATTLRALLHTHRDVCSYSNRLKTKLFLRTDLLDRVTADVAFVNATHLRTHRIVWNVPSIIDFVAKRLVGSQDVAAKLGITTESIATSTGRQAAFDQLVPPGISDKATFDGPQWLIHYTSDASNSPNPRNILTLLRQARSQQLQICERDHPTVEQVGSVLSKQAIRTGQRLMSRIRVEDTLYAEFNELRDWFDAIRGRPFTYTPEQFAQTFGYATADDLEVIIDDLKYAGFFSQAPNGQLTVPLLYRSGLNLQQRADPRTPSQTPRKRPPHRGRGRENRN
jgi:hypothetical protein